ncbi:glutathione S-transferase N-terminal domain-containing protein [Exilibacterium tricleocarpae]|uniref:glutathione S-transferase N-terminal domain-containing protein n=1 Tax=Exilibacterium tricleocarpae TaxID=2591008 RepID=UPI001FEAA271|nr:glutathione S-transferase N-terminal domain-containing protein [Exilibacterium tricleocarpae]
MVELYSYFRSSASYRVRIGLNLKHLNHKIVPVDLAGDEQHSDSYREKHPRAWCRPW